jgi:hypothetical protein
MNDPHSLLGEADAAGSLVIRLSVHADTQARQSDRFGSSENAGTIHA